MCYSTLRALKGTHDCAPDSRDMKSTGGTGKESMRLFNEIVDLMEDSMVDDDDDDEEKLGIVFVERDRCMDE
jgi:hypothetical protein